MVMADEAQIYNRRCLSLRDEYFLLKAFDDEINTLNHHMPSVTTSELSSKSSKVIWDALRLQRVNIQAGQVDIRLKPMLWSPSRALKASSTVFSTASHPSPFSGQLCIACVKVEPRTRPKPANSVPSPFGPISSSKGFET